MPRKPALTPTGASRVTKRLEPGERGTKKLLERFGQKLLAVRYRQSADGTKRYITVELLISSREAPRTRDRQMDPIVEIRTQTHEVALHDKLKANGAVWNGRTQTWKVQHSIVIKLGIARKMTQNNQI